MIRAHKIRIYPNQNQRSYFRRACGIKRFAYNWSLIESKKHYAETGKTLTGYDLCKRLNVIKKERFPWMYEVTKWAPQKASYDFYDAIKRFFKKKSKFPRLKKKGKCKESFYLGMTAFILKEKKLKISRLGWIKMAQSLRFQGKLVSATISETAGRWFASVQVELDEFYVYPHNCKTQAIVGVDLGVKDLAVLSTGEKVKASRSLFVCSRKLRKLNKSLARKKKGSENRKKARIKLASLYWKISSTRNDLLHKTTTDLVKRFRFIGIEDLSVSSMLKNKHLARSISDASFYEFRRQLEYKSEQSGSTVVVADRFFPSTKTCHVCKEKQDLKLSDRSWQCAACGASHDRDLNAAYNLRNVAARHADTLNACGEESSGSDHLIKTKLSSEKQEINLVWYVDRSMVVTCLGFTQG